MSLEINKNQQIIEGEASETDSDDPKGVSSNLKTTVQEVNNFFFYFYKK